MNTVAIDLDNTLCVTVDADYSKSIPIQNRIDAVNYLYIDHYILIYTARGGTTGIDWSDLTTKQLREWGVKYHELSFQKPHFDSLIDDKAGNENCLDLISASKKSEFLSIYAHNIETSISLMRLMSSYNFMLNIDKIASYCKTSLKSGSKFIFAGNGGSASDSAHIAAELVARLRVNRSAIPALALGTNISTVTAWANDYDYETGLARELEAVGCPNDILFMLSTSGKSRNIAYLAKTARSLGIKCVLVSGVSPTITSDFLITIPGERTERIQELYMLLLHTICEHLELP